MTSGLLVYILKYGSIASVLLPLICSIMRFRVIKPFLQGLILYLLISIVTEIIAAWRGFTGQNTYLLYNIYTILECSCLSYLFWRKYNSQLVRLLVGLFFMPFLAIAFFSFVVSGLHSSADNIVSTYSAVYLVTLACIYFYRGSDENLERLTDDYFFWISTAVMLYFSVAVLFFLFNDYIEKRGIRTAYYGFRWIINIATNILFTIGIWKVRK